MYILYEGPSKYDGKPIVVIATKNSKNKKTGNMWQTWIMLQDTPPHKAVNNGDDFSVCGNCPLRPISYKSNGLKDSCYVITWQAPLSIWNAYQRGSYERITPTEFRQIVRDDSDGVRLGSYGDPACLPVDFWKSIGVGTGEFNFTSYTHGYLMPNFDKTYLEFSMISIDPVTEQLPELPQGRTYRAITSVDQIRSDEILCPASKEQNYKTTCSKCGLCAGLFSKAKNIAIKIH